METRTYSVEEAAQVLGISRATAWRAISRGELPVLRVGRRVLVKKDAIDAMLSVNGAPKGAA